PGDDAARPGGGASNSGTSNRGASTGGGTGSPANNAGAATDPAGAGQLNQPATQYTQTEAVQAASTSGDAPPARAALAVPLAFGLAGLIAGPLLLRRREVGS
ncbi:MAG: hypothetical protein LBD70_03490, partial [Bifidobacteriaceae bacterium]|nr:hypothetical protein [Bifidobacteriaceae bacterium]